MALLFKQNLTDYKTLNMKTSQTKQITLILPVILLTLFGCIQTKEEKAFKVFNEGVAFSLDAGKSMEVGNEEIGTKKYNQSIEKFKETLQIDSNHKGVAGALGHNYYEITEYDEAIKWFTKATKDQPEFAVSYHFLGLSQINKGRVEEGEKNIKRAFEMDTSEEMRYSTISNLVHIGNLAYSYGDAYEEEGNEKQGADYHKFGVRVLMTALEYSNNDNEIIKMIEGYAVKMNDESLLMWVEDQKKII